LLTHMRLFHQAV